MKKDTTKDNAKGYNPTHEFFVAGVQYHQMHRILKSLHEGNQLQLVAEPTNKYDPNAVRIECSAVDENVMCGYVPKKFSSEVRAMFEVGKSLECVITELNPTAKPWEWCKVQIREVQDA